MTAAPATMHETARRGSNHPGHDTGGVAPMQASGYCECGCGEKTPLATRKNVTRGYIKGEPIRYVPGHQGRAPKKPGPRWLEEDRGYETPCWIWQRNLSRQGYGQVKVNYKSCRAHRVVYGEHRGPIPEGLELDHLCRVRSCVNPDHLEPVTCQENLRRGITTKLNPAKVREIRRLIAEGVPIIEIAARFAVHDSAIHKVKSGERWSDVK